jgi:hypothetical protein
MIARLTGTLFFGLMVACSGSQKEASAPEPESNESPEPPPESESAGEEEAPADESSSNSSGGEYLSPEILRTTLQLVIQDDALQTAMNLTVPGRFPIKISGKDIPSNIDLVAATKAVEVVPMPEDPTKQPVLVFTSIELEGNTVTFKYRYEVEKIRGTSKVVKGSSAWELKSSRISEY